MAWLLQQLERRDSERAKLDESLAQRDALIKALANKRAAAIQSLFATAKLNDIEPAAWLKDTLEKLPTWPNSRIDELLPIRLKA